MDSNWRSPLQADSGQRIVSKSSSLDSTAQTGNSEWQEEIYQKIKVLKDLYFQEIHVVYQKLCSKLQRLESPPQRVKSGVLSKQMLERILQYLQIPESDIQHFHKYRLETLEKQILSILSAHRASQPSPTLQQGEIPQPHLQSLQQNRQSHAQIHQCQLHESGVNSKLESINVEASLDSTARTGNSEWQEEIYQKINVLKDLYFAEIHVVYLKLCSTLQQQQSPPQRVKSGVLEEIKSFKQMVEGILQYLQVSQSDIQHFHKDSLKTLEKLIMRVLSAHRAALQQGEIPQPHLQPLQQNRQSHSQIHQSQSHESGVYSKLESINVEGSSVPTMQLSEMSGLHGSLSSFPGINFSQPNMMNSLQPCSNLDLGQGNAPISVQKVAMGSIQENPVRAPQQASANSSTPDIGANLFHLSSLDSTAQTGNSDLQEEIYQKIKVMKDLYFSEAHDIYQKMCAKMLQHDSLPQQTKSDEVEKLEMLERILQYLQIPRNRIQTFHKERLLTLEKEILSILSSHRPRKPCPPLQQRQIPQPHLHSLQQNEPSQSHESINSSQPNMMDSFIEAPSASVDSTAHTANFDWQEEVYQKLKSRMTRTLQTYVQRAIYQKMSAKLEHLCSKN